MALFWQDSFETETGPDLGSGTRVAVGHDDTNNGTGPFDRNGDGTIDSTDQVELGVGNDPAGNFDFNTTGDNNFFVRYDGPRDPNLGVDRNFSAAADGDFIWIGEDVRDSRNGESDPANLRDTDLGIIDWQGINTSGLTDISFKGLFVSNQNGGTFEVGDFVRVSYAFDSTDEADLITGLQFLGNGVRSDGLIWDENLNGVIDANETTEMGVFVGSTRMDLEEFGFDLTGSGNTLYVRYQQFDGTSGGSAELIAIDNFRLENAGTATPPTGPTEGTPNRDVIDGTSDADTINGNDGNDVLRGAGGDDTLNGGDGNDGLNGGAGADVLDGGAGVDSAVYLRSMVGVTVDLSDGSNNTGEAAGDTFISIERIFGSNNTDILVGDANDNFFDGRDGNDMISGGDGADTLHGRVGDDMLSGDAGNDRLEGGIGEDTLLGGAGSDRLYGDEGNDIVVGGLGRDVLIGGTGADQFLYNEVDSGISSRDVILGFEDGVDLINYEDASFTFADLNIIASGANSLVISDYGQVVLVGVASTDLDESDFVFSSTVVLAGSPASKVADSLASAQPIASDDAQSDDDFTVIDVDVA